MKRLSVLLVLVLPLLCSCKGHSIKDIKVNSFEIVSLTPKGLKDIDAVVRVDVHNPSVSFELTDLVGVVKYKGKEALTITSDQLIVSGKTDKAYTVPVHGALADDFNPFQLLEMLGSDSSQMFSLDGLTLDLSLRPALRGGIGKKIEINDISLGKLTEKK